MNTNYNEILEFTTILGKLSDCALSPGARARLLATTPLSDERRCAEKMRETTEALDIINRVGSPPLSIMSELSRALESAEKGAMLVPDELAGIGSFLASCRRMKSYLKKAENGECGVALYGGSFYELATLSQELERSIQNGAVCSEATPALRDIRRKIENANINVRTKLESILRSKKEWFSDGYVTTRNGRFVLPVKKEYKNQVSGSVIDTSGAGGTCFIEPTAVRKLTEDISLLQTAEENEIRKVLYTLTALVDEQMSELKINMDCMETLDTVFAKAKLSMDMKAGPVPVRSERYIKIIDGRHPLLSAETCVPLNFEIGNGTTGVVITGPNTGGKTVALKTVGLLSLMAQSGLHVPAGEGSVFSLNSGVLCDIGDGQSITENLSTFSAHVTNIIGILKKLDSGSLVLLDELGSGTDPAEGMGLAVSVLEELRSRGCLFVATTHYPEVKEYAARAERLINARMEFDRESMQPLYRLLIGEAGESCALYIARRLGFPEHMLKMAYDEAYKSDKPQNDTGAQRPKMRFLEDEVKKSASEAAQRTATARTVKAPPPAKTAPAGGAFSLGDSVRVHPEKALGIVCERANAAGEICVIIKGERQLVNHKRIKLETPASALYPDDYDFSVIFDTVENRKARRQMEKGHRPDLEIKFPG